MEQQHRAFGVALLETWADHLCDLDVDEAMCYWCATGLSKHPEPATTVAVDAAQWARWIARNPEHGDVFTLRDLLARTIIEVQP